MTFEIVKYRHPGLRYAITFFALLFFILIFILFSDEHKTIFLILIITNIISFAVSFDKLNYIKIGECEITENELSLKFDDHVENYKINNFSDILINHKLFYHNSFLVKTENVLKLTFQKQEEEFTLLAYIRGKKKKIEFIELLKELYKKGINIRESNENGKRTFLFKGNLKYQEIQNIKKEYEINWF